MSDLFTRSDPAARAAYEAILAAAARLGPVRAEEKQTSIHLMAGTAFAGVHPRKAGVLLNIRSAAPITNPRIRKTERVSAHRFHNELLIASPAEVDADVVGWLKDAYLLSGGRAAAPPA